MKNFARALKEAWRYWPTLTAGLLCSFVAAALWGVNIAALFPIIETTLHGQSLQAWNQKRVAAAHERLDELKAEIADLEQRLPAAQGEQRQALELQADVARTRLKAQEVSAYSAEQLQPLIDRYLPNKPFQTVLMIVTFVAVATLVKQTLSIINTMLVGYVSQSISRGIRLRIFDKALSLDRPGFNKVGTSGFSAHIMQTTDMLAGGLTNFYGGAIAEPLRILACLTGAWLISWRLTIASLVCAPLVAYLMFVLNRRIRAVAVRTLDRSLGFHHVMLEVFGSLLTVQAYTMEDFERKRFYNATKEMRRSALLAQFYNTLTNPLTEVMGIGMLCTALALSAYLVINRETSIFGIPMADEPLTIPAVTVFFGMLIGAADPLRKISGVVSGINTGMAAANMLYPLLEVQSSVAETTAPQSVGSPHRAIEFRNVRFTYDGHHDVLKNVNLTISFGEHLAIVGPNGGGKSTLMNLLCRFYDPQEGEVCLDGVSLRNLPLKDLRSRIALVTQQTELFNETILHNIRYGRWDASEEEIIAAAKRAKAHDFIAGFPEGYQTQVGPNGQRLSGGQRQRIALARAFLRNAEILILDEATSQIDRDSEQLIHDALSDFGRDRTLIMITHRESTLSLATMIAEVKHGGVTLTTKPSVDTADAADQTDKPLPQAA